MGESYPVRIWSGLLAPHHRKRMGTALWEFLWLVDKVTREEDGRGCVLGGKPVTCREIAADLGLTDRAVWSALARLRTQGYIQVTRRPAGLAIVVLKSKKWRSLPPKAAKSGHAPSFGSRRARSEETAATAPKERSARSERTVRPESNICSPSLEDSFRPPRSHDMYRDSTEDGTVDRPIDNVFQGIDGLPDDKQRELGLRAVEEMASQPFGRSFLVEQDGRWMLARKPACRMMHRMFMLRIWRREKEAELAGSRS